MNQYELGVIVSARLEEENQNAELERVQELVTRFGGTIDKVDNWGRRRLAYPIQKQQDGVYTFITFSSEGGAPAEIEARIRIMENVLRFLIIRIDD
jgi:small subunit ribosomal protein S6